MLHLMSEPEGDEEAYLERIAELGARLSERGRQQVLRELHRWAQREPVAEGEKLDAAAD